MRKFFFPEQDILGFSRIDNTVLFYNQVNSLLRPEMIVLDFGAGRGAADPSPSAYRTELKRLRGKVKKVIGADVDYIVQTNESLDEAILITEDGKIGLPDRCTDLIVSDWVFEHLPVPAQTASELYRILKPGGWICARTPNKYGYISLFQRVIPDAFKNILLQKLQPSREKCDVFPAYYRLNTSKDIRRFFEESKYRILSIKVDSEPAYAGKSKLLYTIFMLYHYITPPPLKTILLIFLQKK